MNHLAKASLILCLASLVAVAGCSPEGPPPRQMDMGTAGPIDVNPPSMLADTDRVFADQQPTRAKLRTPEPTRVAETATWVPETPAPPADFQLAAAPIAGPAPAPPQDTESIPTPAGEPDVKPAIESIPTPEGQPIASAEPTPAASPKPAATPTPAAEPATADAPKISFNNALRPESPSEATSSRSDLREASTANAASVEELAPSGEGAPMGGPIDYAKWPQPQVTLVFSGQQHGYIEPCGCTGLDRQKGGVARRFTLLENLEKLGWTTLPIDTGNLIRRYGSQGHIKFHRSVEALRNMNYVAVGFGPDDVRLSASDLLQEAAAESPEMELYASANVVLFDPSLMPTYRIVEENDVKVGVTSILDPDFLEKQPNADVQILPPIDSAKSALKKMEAQSPTFRVLTYFGDEEAAQDLVRQVAGFDLLVVSGGYGEPIYQPKSIEGSQTKMIVTGNKGMYVGLVGLYPDAEFRYARVALSDQFEDAPEMRKLMADYQDQLRDLGLDGLGLEPKPHPSGKEFVGSETCGDCHTTAYEIWEASDHFLATDHIVEPPEERGDIPRHFDPECISCHVTGWNPQKYSPYTSGYLSLEASSHLTGNGCENCHGPGAKHAAAEMGDIDVSEDEQTELRLGMQLPLEKAREKCMECHDLDNSPDFHDEGAFADEYWPEVAHEGLD